MITKSLISLLFVSFLLGCASGAPKRTASGELDLKECKALGEFWGEYTSQANFATEMGKGFSSTIRNGLRAQARLMGGDAVQVVGASPTHIKAAAYRCQEMPSREVTFVLPADKKFKKAE